jgi:antitoxin MazE
MVAKIQRWGNSLAVRIPNTIAKDLHISQGSQIELKQLDDKIIIAPKQDKPNLKAMLARITKSNRHPEINTHKVVGNENW